MTHQTSLMKSLIGAAALGVAAALPRGTHRS
jgi:hypothetical protein